MDLISCKNCGIVLDKDHLPFPTNIHTEEDCIDLNLALYNQRNGLYTPYVPCPICKEPILKRD